jgi:hypothetical protein
MYDFFIVSSQTEIQYPENTDRLIAGDQYESSLIKLLYEMDAGAQYEGFLICETGPGDPYGYIENPRARINELFESVGIGSKDWTKNVLKNDNHKHGVWKTLSVSDRRARGLKLDGVSIGDFFTMSADVALPIESGEDGEMYIEMLFHISDKYILNLRASGSVAFIYPRLGDGEEKSGDSELEYGILYEADILHKDILVAND